MIGIQKTTSGHSTTVFRKALNAKTVALRLDGISHLEVQADIDLRVEECLHGYANEIYDLFSTALTGKTYWMRFISNEVRNHNKLVSRLKRPDLKVFVPSETWHYLKQCRSFESQIEKERESRKQLLFQDLSLNIPGRIFPHTKRRVLDNLRQAC